jgi:hypothetical protein
VQWIRSGGRVGRGHQNQPGSLTLPGCRARHRPRPPPRRRLPAVSVTFLMPAEQGGAADSNKFAANASTLDIIVVLGDRSSPRTANNQMISRSCCSRCAWPRSAQCLLLALDRYLARHGSRNRPWRSSLAAWRSIPMLRIPQLEVRSHPLSESSSSESSSTERLNVSGEHCLTG